MFDLEKHCVVEMEEEEEISIRLPQQRVRSMNP